MAGHSKWANIQHRKKAQDAKRGKTFTKLIREITIAARTSGGDIEANPRLRLAVDKALAANMSRDTIDRAIKRGSGDGQACDLESVTYEGYGPGGVAVLVECLTDNRNRTVSEVRHAFSKAGGNLGTDGSVAYLFAAKGQLLFPPDSNEEAIFAAALESGAEDVVTYDDKSLEVITTPEDFTVVKAVLMKQKLIPASADVTKIASTKVEPDDELAAKIEALLDMLEDLDDVQNVYSNLA